MTVFLLLFRLLIEYYFVDAVIPCIIDIGGMIYELILLRFL